MPEIVAHMAQVDVAIKHVGTCRMAQPMCGGVLEAISNGIEIWPTLPKSVGRVLKYRFHDGMNIPAGPWCVPYLRSAITMVSYYWEREVVIILLCVISGLIPAYPLLGTPTASLTPGDS
jgi:hypothetical protein